MVIVIGAIRSIAIGSYGSQLAPVARIPNRDDTFALETEGWAQWESYLYDRYKLE